jgi:hypothetical protein
MASFIEMTRIASHPHPRKLEITLIGAADASLPFRIDKANSLILPPVEFFEVTLRLTRR